MKSEVLIEGCIVGVIFAILLLIISWFMIPDTMIKQISCGFIAGFVGHLVFEIIGANKWYCTNGQACLSVNY